MQRMHPVGGSIRSRLSQCRDRVDHQRNRKSKGSQMGHGGSQAFTGTHLWADPGFHAVCAIRCRNGRGGHQAHRL